MGLVRRVVATVPHYLAVPALIRGTDLIANTRRRLVDVLRTSSAAIFPVPVRMPVPEFSGHSGRSGIAATTAMQDIAGCAT